MTAMAPSPNRPTPPIKPQPAVLGLVDAGLAAGWTKGTTCVGVTGAILTGSSELNALWNLAALWMRLSGSISIACWITAAEFGDILGLICWGGARLSWIVRWTLSAGRCPVSKVYMVAPSA